MLVASIYHNTSGMFTIGHSVLRLGEGGREGGRGREGERGRGREGEGERGRVGQKLIHYQV